MLKNQTSPMAFWLVPGNFLFQLWHKLQFPKMLQVEGFSLQASCSLSPWQSPPCRFREGVLPPAWEEHTWAGEPPPSTCLDQAHTTGSSHLIPLLAASALLSSPLQERYIQHQDQSSPEKASTKVCFVHYENAVDSKHQKEIYNIPTEQHLASF